MLETGELEEGEIPDVIPLRDENRQTFRDTVSEEIGSDSESSGCSEDDFEYKKPKLMSRGIMDGKSCNDSDNHNNMSHNVRVSKRGIWSNVLMEEQITCGLKSSGTLHHRNEALLAERGVEAYHVTKGQSNDSVHCIHPADDDGALWDVTDDGESRNTVKQRVGKRMNVKSRLGKRTRKNGHKSQELSENNTEQVPRDVTAHSSEQVVARYIARGLDEPKTALVLRVVTYAGRQKALDLYSMTENVELAGGMKTHDGKGRRSPGGVFLHLLKSDKGVSQETIKEIFALEKEQQKRQKKEIARENRKRKYGSRTRQKQSDKPVDPLLTSSHTHLSANGAADSGIVDDFETMEEPDIEIGVS